jgi:hypothetical protein
LEAGLKAENFWSRADAARRASGRKGCRRQPAEEAPGQPAAVVENDAARDGLAIAEHFNPIAHRLSKRDMRLMPPPSLRGALLSAEARLRAKADATKQSSFCAAVIWIASRSLSSGAHSRDPLARNDG